MALALFVITLGIVFLKSLQQYDAARVFVTKQGNRIISLFFQVAKTNDIAKGLNRIQNAVGARKSLNQSVMAQVLIHPQSVQSGGIKAGQEHVHHQEQINLAFFYTQRKILVVVLKLLRTAVIIGAKMTVIIPNRLIQKVTRALVQAFGIKTLIHRAIIQILVRVKTINQAYFQLWVALGHLFFQLGVIRLGHIDRGNRKNSVKASQLAIFIKVVTITLGLLLKMVQQIFTDLADALGCHHRALDVNRSHLHIHDFILHLDRVHIVNPKGQDIAVINRIHDRIAMQSLAKDLLRGGCH